MVTWRTSLRYARLRASPTTSLGHSTSSATLDPSSFSVVTFTVWSSLHIRNGMNTSLHYPRIYSYHLLGASVIQALSILPEKTRRKNSNHPPPAIPDTNSKGSGLGGQIALAYPEQAGLPSLMWFKINRFQPRPDLALNNTLLGNRNWP